jgi:hypothetical protein
MKPLPPTFTATREALHRVAEEVVAPARKPHNEIALRATPGGFGTPEFEHEGRRLGVRVEGADLVVEQDGSQRREPLTSIAAAARFVGAELFPDGLPDDATPLAVDRAAAVRLGELYGFASVTLERARLALSAEARASSINLWPEHFDIAFEAGDEVAGSRANVGVSPGDAEHPEPYLYVGPWTAPEPGELWNATAFPGAELGYADLIVAADPARAAAEFINARLGALGTR